MGNILYSKISTDPGLLEIRHSHRFVAVVIQILILFIMQVFGVVIQILTIYYAGYSRAIDQFRYIKIYPKTIDLRTRFWGINPTNSAFIPQSLVLKSIVLG